MNGSKEAQVSVMRESRKMWQTMYIIAWTTHKYGPTGGINT